MPTRALLVRYEQDVELFADLWQRVGLALGLALVVFYPWLVSGYWQIVGQLVLIEVVAAVALMILSGFTGQVSLGHAAFLAVGAYGAGILGEAGWPIWIVIPVCGLLAALVGLAVAPFALRLRGLYLAIVTIGLLFLVRHLLLSLPDLTGGVSGKAIPINIGFGADSWFNDTHIVAGLELTFELKLHYLFALMAIGSILISVNIRRSDLGRSMMAVRDHDLAAAALGVNPARTKIIAFGISAFLAGVAGTLFGFQQQYITVDPFDLNMSVRYIAIIILGGIGTTFGAVAGAAFFVVMVPLAERVSEHVPLLDRLTSTQQSTLLFGALVLAFVLFEPFGLYGVWLRVKRYFMTWPFRY